jgi:hypothetical protein
MQSIKLKDRDRLLNFPQFYWNKEGPKDIDGATAWAYLASKIFEYELDLVVFDSINQVDRAFSWSAINDSSQYALIPLPLAVLGLTLEDFGEEGAEVAAQCANLLQRVQWPAYRGESSSLEVLWEMLEGPESLFSSLDVRNQIERKLEDLLPEPKENS